MPEKPLAIEQILSLLAEHPRRIVAATAGLKAAQLPITPTAEEWSTNDVLAHLRSCSDVWGSCMVAILAEDHPTLRAINPWTWILKTDYRSQKFQPSLRAFTAQRTALLTILEPLKPKDWSRAAKVTGAGKPLERTVHSYAQWLATHERAHVKQIERMYKSLDK